eukprot:5645695-Amphidinium_carterae.2
MAMRHVRVRYDPLHSLDVLVDISFAPQGQKSHERLIVLFGGNVMSWKSGRQSLTATMKWLEVRACQGIHVVVSGVNPCDNHSAIAQTLAGSSSSLKTRHVSIKATSIGRSVKCRPSNCRNKPVMSPTSELETALAIPNQFDAVRGPKRPRLSPRLAGVPYTSVATSSDAVMRSPTPARIINIMITGLINNIVMRRTWKCQLGTLFPLGFYDLVKTLHTNLFRHGNKFWASKWLSEDIS